MADVQIVTVTLSDGTQVQVVAGTPLHELYLALAGFSTTVTASSPDIDLGTVRPMAWFMTPHGPQSIIEPATIEEFRRRDYLELTAQQAADFFAGAVEIPDVSFITGQELPAAMAAAAADDDSPFAVGLRAAFGLGLVDVVRDYGAKVNGTTDDTAAWQSAINAVVAAGGGTVFCSKAGISRIDGPQQTGTANGVAYSGQLLIPARAFTAGRATLRIVGPCPPGMIPLNDSPNEPPTHSGVTLLSNATSGSVLDAVPTEEDTGSGFVATNVHLYLDSLSVLLPSKPTAGGINAAHVATFSSDRVLISVNATPNAAPGGITGPSVGLVTPVHNNQAHVDLRRTSVNYFDTGIKFAEHTHLDNVQVMGCNTALEVYGPGGGHEIKLTKVLVQGSGTVLKSSVTTFLQPIHGSIDIEGAGTSMMIDDPNNKLTGDLSIYNGTTPDYGYPVRGGRGLRLRSAWATAAGHPDSGVSTPWDSFTRSADMADGLGCSDITRHVWRNSAAIACTWTTASGAAKALTFTNAFAFALCRYFMQTGGSSRVITGTFDLAASGYNIGLALDFTSDDYAGIIVGMSGGAVQILRIEGGGFTSLASGGTVTGGTTHTLRVVLSNPQRPGSAYTVSAYLDAATTAAATYTLTSGDLTAINPVSAPRSPRTKQDGLYSVNDLVSTCTEFRVDTLAA